LTEIGFQVKREGIKRMRVFVAGGSGLIGCRLIPALVARGDQAILLSRRGSGLDRQPEVSSQIIQGDPTHPGSWMRAIDDCDCVVNLTGEGIFTRRWDPAFKQRLRSSRLESTNRMVEALSRSPKSAAGTPKTLINSSAIGYYGSLKDEPVTEDTAPGKDYMAELCVEWEAAANKAASLGIRTVQLRTGVVLDKAGGALQEMAKPFRMAGFSGPIGSGKQYVSWIHQADMVGLILLAIDNPAASGPMNATAPNPVTNKEMTKAIGRVLNRPAFVPTPAFAIRLMLGEVAEVVTHGQRVLPKKAEKLGYAFKFPTLDAALHDTLE
jgi:uncharacterized protein (TIGR01777 family)